MLHVVATRMGIGIYDTNWFEFRLALFETITFPSVTKQTNQDFTWLLVIDQHMPASARQRLKDIVQEHPRVKILPIEMKSDFIGAVSAWSKNQNPTDGKMLSTRMDDDDAIKVDAFQKLRDMAAAAMQASCRYGVFSFDIGARWDPFTNTAYSAYHHSIGIGLSMLEPVSEARTVYSRPHLDIKTLMAPKGTYIQSMGGVDPQWLYSHHALSDSDNGAKKRINKIREHKLRYSFSDEELASFGLDATKVAQLALAAQDVSKRESAFRVSTKGIRIEARIKELREKIPHVNGDELAEINKELLELNNERIKLGSGLVK